MASAISPKRYGMLTIGLHWLVLVVLIGVFAAIELREVFPSGSEMRGLMMQTHFSLGMLVVLLTLARLAARAIGGPAPAIEPAPAGWQVALAKGLHLALYVLMIAMPLIGWLMVNAGGRSLFFFGMELPALVGADKEFRDTLKEIHEVGGNLFYILVGLHAVAALVHHHFLRDNTLRRMLPTTAAR